MSAFLRRSGQNPHRWATKGMKSKKELLAKKKGSVATFRFCRNTPRFRDFAEKPIVDCEALRQGGFRAKPGFSEESNLCNTSLLLAFQVQRNNVLNFCAGFSIGKQAKSLASVAKRYRPVARIWAVDGRRFHVKQYCAPVRLL